MKEVKILAIGDIVGKAGRRVLGNKLQTIVERERIDFVIANGENSAGGLSMTPDITREIFSYGVNVITSGNHVWGNNDILQIIDSEPNLIRPANYPPDVPGKGYCLGNIKGIKICVINLMGRVMMNPMDCPFRKFDEIYKIVKDQADIIIVDFHAETTSEKQALGWYVDGRASAIFGTHTHVQTADERILHHGTGYITDIGMTGSMDSVIGMIKERSIRFFLTQTRVKFEPADENPWLNGIIFKINDSGKTVSMTRVQEKG
ncbi:MAG TPA: TIGR00282 family metallophosphoesterase [Spirochaetota bacterium]|nr:TIGR00282 family metallophosphoesterase [Spirochaetota bacterium]HPF06400.1 TIGR00282 family metallophosphoesterase [Spirochaetota bacterium]HPJ41857.1 TIGR00282 family metallophosphoesterase [Spirochaetota bacterium]HPR36825.1 TIGR00282 family metallophosphoesterase [Spirochaetota bacterium]HRX46364.1 TIGR00282 family metallophosphoesterase [Spirochaetota bacterium]